MGPGAVCHPLSSGSISGLCRVWEGAVPSPALLGLALYPPVSPLLTVPGAPRFLDLVGILHRGARPSHPRLRLLIITHRSAAQTPGRLAVACLIRTPLNSPFAAGRLRCNTFNLISVVLDVRTVSLSCYFNEAA